MRKIYLLLAICPCFLFMACNDNWDNYYKSGGEDGEESISTQNLLEFLEANLQYSKFVELLKETKVDAELSRNQVLTVWAPTNESMPAGIESMSIEDKKTLCQNHINYIALYNTKLEDEKVIKTLAGKNLIINELTLDQFIIDGIQITKLNEKCTNGVIHEIAEWMLPRLSIYEFLDRVGDEYSIFRDSILILNDTIFKPSLSFPLDVDELGNTIYDSVFVIENPILSKIDFRDEDNDFTLFLPSNKAIEDMYEYMQNYLAGTGKVMTEDDSLKFFTWVQQATMFKGKIENSQGSHISVYDYIWRGEKQHVSGERQVCSNGYIYEVEELYIPKFLYLDAIKAHPFYIGEIDESERSNYYATENVTSINWAYKPDKDPEMTVMINGTRPVFEFDTFIKDYMGQLQEGKIMPGFYKISMSFRAYLCGTVKVSINGEEVVTTPNINNSGNYNYAPGPISDEFEIKEEWGYNMIRVRLEDTSGANRLAPSYILLEPTQNNY